MKKVSLLRYWILRSGAIHTHWPEHAARLGGRVRGRGYEASSRHDKRQADNAFLGLALKRALTDEERAGYFLYLLTPHGQKTKALREFWRGASTRTIYKRLAEIEEKIRRELAREHMIF